MREAVRRCLDLESWGGGGSSDLEFGIRDLEGWRQ